MTASPISIVTSRDRPEQVREASLVVIIVLLLRPQGLLGSRLREDVATA